VPTVGDDQLGREHLPFLRRGGIEQGVGMRGGKGLQRAVAEVFRHADEAFGTGFRQHEVRFRGRLPADEHPSGAGSEGGCEAVAEVRVLHAGVAADDPFGRQFRDGEVEERFGDGDVDVYGTLHVVVECEQGLVDESVAVPCLLLAPHFGQVHRTAYQ